MARRGIVLLLSAVVSLSMVGEAAAHTFNRSTSIKVKRIVTVKKVVVTGELTGNECQAGKTVQLVKASGAVKKTAVTDNEGEFLFKVRRGKRSKRFVVRFQGTSETNYGHSHVCGASESKSIKIPRRPNND